MNLVIGCPVAERAWILPAWFDAIERQDIECEIVCVLSPSEDDTEQILKDHGVTVLYDERPARARREIESHCWGALTTYTFMADLRNQLLEYVIEQHNPDYFFSLDSDIILSDGVLHRLLTSAVRYPGVMAPAVNMVTVGTAWNTMGWTDIYNPGAATRRIKNPPSGQADVVMAAMMLDREGMTCRWESHQQGEDVGFSLDARRKQVPLWWLSDIRCEHKMRKF